MRARVERLLVLRFIRLGAWHERRPRRVVDQCSKRMPPLLLRSRFQHRQRDVTAGAHPLLLPAAEGVNVDGEGLDGDIVELAAQAGMTPPRPLTIPSVIVFLSGA